MVLKLGFGNVALIFNANFYVAFLHRILGYELLLKNIAENVISAVQANISI